MRDSVVWACLLVLGVVAYIERDRIFPPKEPEVVYAPPAPKHLEHHLAPEGTFYMVDYVSMRTPRGIVGFERGREVHFVSADKSKGTLVVTDGQYQIEVKPMQLTNDMDLGALARMQDQDSQAQVTAAIESQREMANNAHLQIDLERAKHVATINGGAIIGGGTTKLDSKAAQVGIWEPPYRNYGYNYYGSPYYYLNR